MSLFEQVTPSVRVAKSGTGIRVVAQGERALLVDTGLDENLVRKVVNALANEGVQVAGIVNSDASPSATGALRAPRVLARGTLPRSLRARGPFPRATHAHADHIGSGACGRVLCPSSAGEGVR